MSTYRILWHSALQRGLLSLTLLAGLTACKAHGPLTTGGITGPDQVARALEAAGAVVNPAPGSSLIAPLPGAVYLVNGEQVQIGPVTESELPLEADTGDLYWTGQGWYVAYAGKDGGMILLLSGLLGEPLRTNTASFEEPFPPAVPLAMRALAKAEGRAPQEITVQYYQPVTWPDVCLGLGQPGEACALVEAPGWLIRVELDARVYDLHSDQAGEIVRWSESGSIRQADQP